MSLSDLTRWLLADWTHAVAALGVLALGYALASLLVGLALEWARPIVRAHGERAARRIARDSVPPEEK